MRRKTKFYVGAAVVIVVGIAIFGTLSASWETVPDGHVGVETEFGRATGNTLQPGGHFVFPPWKEVHAIECRPRTYTMSNSIGEGKKSDKKDAIVAKSANGTTHPIDVTVRYEVDCGQAVTFYQRWHSEEQMEHRLIRPDVRSDALDEAASIESLTIFQTEGRDALTTTTRSTLRENFRDEPVKLRAVKVRDVELPPGLGEELEKRQEAKAAVERKQHEVEVERKEAERKRVAAEADADVERIRAQGESDSMKIRAQAAEDHPVVVQLEYIRALENGEAIYVPSDGPPQPVIDVDEDSNNSSDDDSSGGG